MSGCFISYSWDSEEHKQWVKNFADRLRSEGVKVKVDGDLQLGEQIPHFMERSIRETDFVLVVCTPTYKSKSENRTGGVGYEGGLITAELLSNQNTRKFIPVLRKGTWEESLPSWLAARLGVDLSGKGQEESEYNSLLTTLKQSFEQAPQIDKTTIEDVRNIETPVTYTNNEDSNTDIFIEGILLDKVTLPRNDGSRGSALYAIPFKLNRIPTSYWASRFPQNWDRPLAFTSMHRPGIAHVIDNTIVLDGTDIDEVKKYHRETLMLAVSETNKNERDYLDKQRRENERKQKFIQDHNNHVRDVGSSISF